MVGIYCFILMVLLMILSIPVIPSLGLASVATLAMTRGGFKIISISLGTINALNSFTLLALPMFLFTGKIMNEGGITTRIFNFARKLVGWLPGGMAMVNIFASMVFGGMSGTSTADAGGLGAIEIKAMREDRYDDEFTGSVTAASAILSPLIPPSLNVVIYVSITGASIMGMFMAGLCAGVAWALIMMLMVQFFAHKRNYARDPLPKLREVWKAFKEAFLSLMAPVILLIGIYSGVFTATEAAAIVVVYCTVLTTVVYRLVNPQRLWEIFKETAMDVTVIGGVLAVATMFGQVIVRTKLPQTLVNLIVAYVDNRALFILLVVLLIVFLGMLMDGAVITVIVTPMLLSVLEVFQINLIHFGILQLVALTLGALTPPYGMTTFITARILNMPMLRLAKAMVPWMAALLLFTLAVAYFPGFVTWLPSLMGFM
ncbi:TRAP transporter large permease [Pseudoflavonifractor sp. 60]|uniref:TRAP transporter large permease n=1 Tax=Pseudoflavonifractor sp. 60 TaxID=2304576 RepID=UPI00136C2EC0|nr:TRAP transporter large permease [Pseudoflavonifractor sp. 60]MCI8914545.1 TRAP transporter large permease [Lawsonibacter sp.]NBI68988.1 TRAP transporter large permease [Pseudoflavonifractor sp. 60]